MDGGWWTPEAVAAVRAVREAGTYTDGEMTQLLLALRAANCPEAEILIRLDPMYDCRHLAEYRALALAELLGGEYAESAEWFEDVSRQWGGQREPELILNDYGEFWRRQETVYVEFDYPDVLVEDARVPWAHFARVMAVPPDDIHCKSDCPYFYESQDPCAC